MHICICIYIYVHIYIYSIYTHRARFARPAKEPAHNFKVKYNNTHTNNRLCIYMAIYIKTCIYIYIYKYTHIYITKYIERTIRSVSARTCL